MLPIVLDLSGAAFYAKSLWHYLVFDYCYECMDMWNYVMSLLLNYDMQASSLIDMIPRRFDFFMLWDEVALAWLYQHVIDCSTNYHV